jgi:hypothetical protein
LLRLVTNPFFSDRFFIFLLRLVTNPSFSDRFFVF